jgi:hypothetical protein
MQTFQIRPFCDVHTLYKIHVILPVLTKITKRVASGHLLRRRQPALTRGGAGPFFPPRAKSDHTASSSPRSAPIRIFPSIPASPRRVASTPPFLLPDISNLPAAAATPAKPPILSDPLSPPPISRAQQTLGTAAAHGLRQQARPQPAGSGARRLLLLLLFLREGLPPLARRAMQPLPLPLPPQRATRGRRQPQSPQPTGRPRRRRPRLAQPQLRRRARRRQRRP